jgi:hypothetical protein
VVVLHGTRNQPRMALLRRSKVAGPEPRIATTRPRSGLARGGLGAKLGDGACTILRLGAHVLVGVGSGKREIVGEWKWPDGI